MIYKLARSLSSNNYEDLFQVGVIGLINAFNNYKSEFNTKFSTYAYPYILGEMKKYIRENKGIKVSKELEYLSSRLNRLSELLTQKYKRSPTTKELSIETGIDEWKIIDALDLRNSIKSIDEEVTDDISIIDTIPVSDKDNTEVDEMLSKLTDEEKSFIINRYYYDASQQEMASITGYSQAKVSRCESKILQKLRSYYK